MKVTAKEVKSKTSQALLQSDFSIDKIYQSVDFLRRQYIAEKNKINIY